MNSPALEYTLSQTGSLYLEHLPHTCACVYVFMYACMWHVCVCRCAGTLNCLGQILILGGLLNHVYILFFETGSPAKQKITVFLE